MRRHIVSRTERAILSGLKRWNKEVPEEVLAAEARQLLRARMLRDNDRGRTQLDIARRLNYSVSQVERLIKVARVEREDGEPSPLMLWKARAKDKGPAPEPEAVIAQRTLPEDSVFRATNMSERSLRLKRDTPLENVIAAWNGLAERVDALEAKGGPAEPNGRHMVRAVLTDNASDYSRDEDGRSTWAVDATYSAHQAPFSAGDIIVDAKGWSGFRQVVEVQPDPDEPRMVRLVIKRAPDLVFDDEAS